MRLNALVITAAVATVGVVARLIAIDAHIAIATAVRRLGRAIMDARHHHRLRRRVKRRPIRTRKAMYKRAAHRYAEEISGHPLSWKAARKLMRNLDRIGREAKRAKAAEKLAARVAQSEALTFQAGRARVLDQMGTQH